MSRNKSQVFAFGIIIGNIIDVKAEELIAYREKLGLTREELARELKTTYPTIFRWEKGDRAIPPYLELALEALQSRQTKKLKKSATDES